MKSGRLILVLVSLGIVMADVSLAQPVITSISEIRRLEPELAAQKIPVLLEAQVIRANPLERSFFVYSDQGGIYVQRMVSDEDYEDVLQPVAGDWVRIQGETSAGDYSPAIVADTVEVMDARSLPSARPFQLDDLNGAGSDCAWVSMRGRLTSMLVPGAQYFELLATVELYGVLEISVQIPYSEETVKRLSELMFREVQFNALLGTVYNRQRQQTARIALVNSGADFSPLQQKGFSEETKILPIHKLMRSDTDHRKPIRTRGVVTYVGSGEFFLRGEEASLKVVILDSAGIRAGQTVEVEGFVWPQSISPAFRAWSATILQNDGPVPEPKPLDLAALVGSGLIEDLMDSALNYERVKVKAQLVEIGKSFGLTPNNLENTGKKSLLCRSGEHLFEAQLPGDMELGADLKPGALLELTGICHLLEDRRLSWRLYYAGLWLQVQGADGIVVVQNAPWWTAKRLRWVFVLTLSMALLLMAWVMSLHKTVDRQTALIGKQIKRQTVLNERQRIARELHDNLEQGLAGMAIQLKGCQKLLEVNAEKLVNTIKTAIGMASHADHRLEEHLQRQLNDVEQDFKKSRRAVKVVQSMLTHCSDESRSSILDLRGGLLERMDFRAALKEVLESLATECGAKLNITLEGDPRALKQALERGLLLIAKEAASNAARHGLPKRIDVKLLYRPDSIVLTIADDGCGFLIEQLSNTGRFGLQGMQERSNQLNGHVHIDSTPGKGTTVTVEIPITADEETKRK